MNRGLVINNRARVVSHMVESRERFKKLGKVDNNSPIAIAMANAEIDYSLALGTELNFGENGK